MQPYYVLALFGKVEEGPSKKFGVVGANDPVEAEEIVLKLAEEAKGRGEVASLAILQLYRNYPATLLDECSELRKEVRESKERISRMSTQLEAFKTIAEQKTRFEQKTRRKRGHGARS